MSSSTRPSLSALLRRDYPAQAFGIFAALFALGALGGAVAMLRVDAGDMVQVAIFIGLFSAFALGCAAVFARRLSWIVGLTRRGVVVDGKVLLSDTNSEDIWYLAVNYEFDGREYRFTQGTGTKSRFEPGAAVRLLVDPQRPDRAWLAESNC